MISQITDLRPPLVSGWAHRLGMSFLVSLEVRPDVRNLGALGKTGRNWELGGGVDGHVVLCLGLSSKSAKSVEGSSR